MFSTHYHALIEDFEKKFGVENFHMAYRCSKGQNDKVLFLYKFVRGACDMSFGLNVARMCGIEKSIIDRATKKSEAFSKNLNQVRAKIDGRT